MAEENLLIILLFKIQVVVKKKTGVIAITDNTTGALVTTFSVTTLKGLNQLNCHTLESSFSEFSEATKVRNSEIMSFDFRCL
jgi:hypothetical protein